MMTGGPSGAFEHLAHSRDDALPEAALRRQLAPAGRSQPIRLDPSSLIVDVPFSGNPAFQLEPVERGEQRASLDDECAAGQLADAFGNPHAVQRLEVERAKDQQIQGALEQIGFSRRRAPPEPERRSRVRGRDIEGLQESDSAGV
jgi:hypothetical protein